jgi:hypothetical protein
MDLQEDSRVLSAAMVVDPADLDASSPDLDALFVWTYQQNQQPSSSVFLSQQTNEQCFQHNKPAKRTGRYYPLSCSYGKRNIGQTSCMYYGVCTMRYARN